MSTQKGEVPDDLCSFQLDQVFKNLTVVKPDTEVSRTDSARRKTSPKFVSNSGLVPYASSSDSMDEDDSVDILNDSPQTPLFSAAHQRISVQPTSLHVSRDLLLNLSYKNWLVRVLQSQQIAKFHGQ